MARFTVPPPLLDERPRRLARDGRVELPVERSTALSMAVTRGPNSRRCMSDARARYVLRSTQEWGRPIDRAVLEVRVPEDRQCNIIPDLPFVRIVDGQRVFRGEFLAFQRRIYSSSFPPATVRARHRTRAMP